MSSALHLPGTLVPTPWGDWRYVCAFLPHNVPRATATTERLQAPMRWSEEPPPVFVAGGECHPLLYGPGLSDGGVVGSIRHRVHAMTPHCGRCQAALPPIDPERCWYCFAPLCGACWEAYGCCAHPAADALNAQVRAGYRPTRQELTAGHPPNA